MQPTNQFVTATLCDNIAQYEPGTIVNYAQFGVIQYVRTLFEIPAWTKLAVDSQSFVVSPSFIGTLIATQTIPPYTYFWASVQNNQNTVNTAMTYTTGTVSAINNSTTVTGLGTNWVINNLTTDYFIQIGNDVSWYEIISINSNTNLTLGTPYTGPTVTNTSYSMITQAEFIKTVLPPITSTELEINAIDDGTSAIVSAIIFG